VQPPQGYYQPGPPPKKKHTVRNILLVLVLLFVLFIGGCMALLGTAANEIDKSIKDEEANDKPTAVAAGKAFTHDDFKVDAGWKVSKDGLGGVTIEGLRVTNDSKEARTALFDFTFYKGKENLAEVTCSSNELQGGESSKLDCFGDDFPVGYKTIKVADSF
jgi:hypothetical protein